MQGVVSMLRLAHPVNQAMQGVVIVLRLAHPVNQAMQGVVSVLRLAHPVNQAMQGVVRVHGRRCCGCKRPCSVCACQQAPCAPCRNAVLLLVVKMCRGHFSEHTLLQACSAGGSWDAAALVSNAGSHGTSEHSRGTSVHAFLSTGNAGMYWDVVVLACTGMYWDVVVLACTGMYWDVLGAGMYWDVLGCTGMWWCWHVLGCTGRWHVLGCGGAGG